ncbi:MAG: RsmB/NOP family class I SAM-dependent RNA methyltransferase [Gammaproteobacteria bacterium]|nr:RsmB/NOP family class I SAM-dependent RNA methyltransferase [Gammaproteobacteria bacterium]
MSKPLLFRSAAELLESVLSSHQAADKQMERFFRDHPMLGRSDRGFVAETVYGCLRHRRSLTYLLDKDPASAQDLVAAYLLTEAGFSARALAEADPQLPGPDLAALAARARNPGSDLPLGVRTDLPDWLLHRLISQYGEAGTLELAAGLNRPASLDLRVNTLKADRTAVAGRLAEEGYTVAPTPWSTLGLRSRDRAPLFGTAAFRDGWFEIQDEGSQLSGMLLEPRRREMVVDFCAGAGGKTLQLGAMMANSGTIYAFDVSRQRLERLKPRLRRAGLDNVRLIAIAHERDSRIQRLQGKIDRVLVDAPCTGTGTLRRNPDIKWREPDLAELVATQKRVLAAAATLVKPGGRLVYVTCSLLREENDDVVGEFRARHPDFQPQPAAEILARRGTDISMDDDALRLYPHRHNTDGFYAMALDRAR